MHYAGRIMGFNIRQTRQATNVKNLESIGLSWSYIFYTTVLPPNLKDLSSGFCNFYRFNFNRSFFAEQIVSSVPYHVCARSSCLQSRLLCSVPCEYFIWKNRWFISWHFFHQWVFHTHQFSTMLWTTFFVKGTDIAGEINKKIASTISLVIISSLYIYANIFALYIYLTM